MRIFLLCCIMIVATAVFAQPANTGNVGIGTSNPKARLHVPGRQIGLLAQNVEKIIPEAVSEKDGYKGVDYARLVPLLIESIKHCKKK